jgi:L-lactate dehydrogenase complex protein LldG
VDEVALFRDWPEARHELRALFRERLRALSADLVEVADVALGAQALVGLLAEVGGRVAAQPCALLERMARASEALRTVLANAADFPDDCQEFAAFEVGITPAERLVARTGSIFLRSDRSGGRQLSVLPPVHVVVATASQLVSSLGDALDQFANDAGACSFATFVTGPSRTADIEKILVLGAHGPKRLVVVLVDE